MISNASCAVIIDSLSTAGQLLSYMYGLDFKKTRSATRHREMNLFDVELRPQFVSVHSVTSPSAIAFAVVFIVFIY